jgi:hypothetical protein
MPQIDDGSDRTDYDMTRRYLSRQFAAGPHDKGGVTRLQPAHCTTLRANVRLAPNSRSVAAMHDLT